MKSFAENKMKHVIIGASAAAVAAAKQIRKNDQKAEITILAKESFFYSRCQLHLAASGKRSVEKMKFVADDWPKKNNINFVAGAEVIGLDPEKQTVLAKSEEKYPYDKLLIATGARAAMLPIDKLVGELTFYLREIEDASAIHDALPKVKNIVIVGAGLVGCELAAALSNSDKNIKIVELAPFPLPMQLEEITGKMCAELLKKNKIELFCNELMSGAERNSKGRPEFVVLKSGKKIPADMIVVAAGVKPNIEFSKGTGIKAGKGLIIDDKCATSLKNVYAAGDVTETEDIILKQIMPSAIWPTAVHQGKVAADNMTGNTESSLKRNTGFKASVSLLGENIISLGLVSKPDPSWEKHVAKHTDSYGKLNVRIFFLDKNHLKGAVFWGNINNAGVYGEAIVNERDISSDLDWLNRVDGAKRGTEKLVSI